GPGRVAADPPGPPPRPTPRRGAARRSPDRRLSHRQHRQRRLPALLRGGGGPRPERSRARGRGSYRSDPELRPDGHRRAVSPGVPAHPGKGPGERGGSAAAARPPDRAALEGAGRVEGEPYRALPEALPRGGRPA